jgi:16S rRNA C967 or C1407 C5-methylase (RsmB/RsmF family)/NOL1/NOP2/fmu family ribosome biogenesis protein
MPHLKLPLDFENKMTKYLGTKEYKSFKNALLGEPETSIRYNPQKKAELKEISQPVPWSENGFYLKERPSFTLDPVFHAGAYYVQEASSMFLEHILHQIQAPKAGVFLDLTAAPGGKSTLLSSYLGNEGLLISNEVIKARASILKENMIKWGIGNTIVTQNDPVHFSQLEGFFDLVLVDAPCSGEGMFRKDPSARSEWSVDNVQFCASRQQRIVDQSAALVKGGGHLVYSTCTFNEEENEEILKFICSEFSYEPVRIPLDPSWGILETSLVVEGSTYFGYRFYPHKVRGEGLFITILKRPEASLTIEPGRTKDFKHPFIKLEGKPLQNKLISQLSLPEDSVIYSLNDSYFWVNSKFKTHFEFLCKYLNIKYFGIELGKYNNEQFIPTHEWAMSRFPKNNFTKWALTLKEALCYLRKEEIQNPNLPQGWILVTYQELPLGWLKNIGKRINNYYPKEWRIRLK